MSPARPFHVLFTLAALQALGFAGMSLFEPTMALGEQDGERRIYFDIPAEPLTLALDAYTTATRKDVLVNSSLVTGIKSTAVRGLYTPDDALKTLLRQTGLAVKNEDEVSFTLDRMTLSESQNSADGSQSEAPDYWPYIALVQSNLHNALCRRPETQPGDYRVGIQLWLAASGRLARFNLIGSTGNRDRDRAILGALATLSIDEPPPADLPEPLSLLIVPLSAPRQTDCTSAPSLP